MSKISQTPQNDQNVPKISKMATIPPTTFKRPKYPLLENLVLHLIQNTQRKQQSWIYFIHER